MADCFARRAGDQPERLRGFRGGLAAGEIIEDYRIYFLLYQGFFGGGIHNWNKAVHNHLELAILCD